MVSLGGHRLGLTHGAAVDHVLQRIAVIAQHVPQDFDRVFAEVFKGLETVRTDVLALLQGFADKGVLET